MKDQIQKMPVQDAKERVKNFSEVPLGYSPEQAIAEAKRCLQCKNAKCIGGCPVHIKIPEFIKLIVEGKFLEAARKIREDSVLPAVCGRVCPQEEQCEKACILHPKNLGIRIGYLERFVADFEAEIEKRETDFVKQVKPSGRKVAVVGSGPSGITCAADLRRMGHAVTLFEALHEPGGVLVYGIPEFRLPKSIVGTEIDFLKKMGVEIKCNVLVGKTFTIPDLFSEGYGAVYLAAGAGLPSLMKIPGENLNYVYSANEFLTRVNLMRAYDFPNYDTPVFVGKNVAVIGGGNTAMDSARCALRLGPDKVYLIYRRSREEMPARVEEIHHGEEEGIEMMLLTNPLRYIGDEQGNVEKAVCRKMELGEPDASGRRRPVPIEGSEFEIEVDSVVVAIGNQANPLVPGATPDLETNKWGNVVADECGATSIKGVFAGGDIVLGSATVISAMEAGRVAAKAIDEYLNAGGKM